MKCINISKDDGEHSLYINPNGLCNKCQMIKDKAVERRLRGSSDYPWKEFREGKIWIKTKNKKESK
jgi:hypothetical protein